MGLPSFHRFRSIARASLFLLALTGVSQTAWAIGTTDTVQPTEDPLNFKTNNTRTPTDRGARQMGADLQTQDENYLELRLYDVANAKTNDQIMEQAGQICIDYFQTERNYKSMSEVKDGDYDYCKQKALGYYTQLLGQTRVNYIQNKATVANLVSPHAPSLGVPTPKDEAKQNPITPSILTLGQIQHIYEGMDQAKPLDPRNTQAVSEAREQNENYKKYGVAAEAFYETAEVDNDPDNPAAGKHTVIKTEGGHPVFNKPAYRQAVAKAMQELNGSGNGAKASPALEARLNYTDTDEAIQRNWLRTTRNPPRGNANGTLATRFKQAFTYKDLDGKTRSTQDAHESTYKVSRLELLNATNKALGDAVAPSSNRGVHLAHIQTIEKRDKANRSTASANAPASADPSRAAEEVEANYRQNERVKIPQGAGDKIGQLSIGYSDKSLDKMMDSAVDEILTAP